METGTEHGPRGEPIGGKVVIAPGALEPAIRATLRNIERVHGATGLPELRVEWMQEDSPRGRYRPAAEGRIARIEVSERGTTPRLTFVHEMGHFLDHVLGGFGAYASASGDSPLAEVIAVAERSRAYRELQNESEDVNRPVFIRRLIRTYLLSREELWARAYSQYVTLRSRDANLAGEIAHVRGQSDYEQFTVWEEQDFVFIGDALEACLRKVGW